MTETITPAIGANFGSWTVHALDRTRKRVLCRCACGAVRELGVTALITGQSLACGLCTATPRPKSPPANSFARDLREAEAQRRGRRR